MGCYSKWVLLLLFDDKYVQCSVHLACSVCCTFHRLWVLYLLQPCDAFACIYTVYNIVNSQSSGIKEAHFCIFKLVANILLHNVWVPDGCQLVSTWGWLCHLYPLLSLHSSPRGLWLTQHLPCLHSRELKRVHPTWQQPQHFWLRGTDLKV